MSEKTMPAPADDELRSPALRMRNALLDAGCRGAWSVDGPNNSRIYAYIAREVVLVQTYEDGGCDVYLRVPGNDLADSIEKAVACATR